MGKNLIKCGVIFMSFLYSMTTQANVFSLHLNKAPIIETLQQLAFEQEKNLVLDDELSGTLTLKLNNVNWEQFLKAVAKNKQLHYAKEQGIYYLTKTQLNDPNPILGSAIDDNKPLETQTFKLQFAKASEVIKTFTTGSGSLLSPNGSISFDERSNMILIQDDRRSLQKVKKLIAELDKPIEQIAIEARIVTMTEEGLKELGVRWGIFEPVQTSHRIAGSLDGKGFNDLTSNLNVNLPISSTASGSVALQVAKIHGRLLDLELSALEQEKNVKIIASPRLLTTNKKSASIKQGTEIPYVVTNRKSDTESVEFREAVLGLEVTPHISKDNSILLDLLVTQNSPGARVSYGHGEIVSIDKQEINTQVFAKNGETIVLGGIFYDTITQSNDKVPVLGSIPVVKSLFSRESDRVQKRELVIFVTPHILKKGETIEGFQGVAMPQHLPRQKGKK